MKIVQEHLLDPMNVAKKGDFSGQHISKHNLGLYSLYIIAK